MVTFYDVHVSFAKAEEDIKFAELSIDSLSSEEDDNCDSAVSPRGVVIPSINELRYAAKHLAKATQKGLSLKDRKEQVRRAERHCVRARLDALKATVLFLVRHFYRFSQDYRMVTLPEKTRNRLNEHRETIQNVLSALSKDHSESTNDECDKLKASIEKLHGFYLDVEKQRDAFNQLLDKMNVHDKDSSSKHDKHDQSTYWQWIASMAFGVVCFILGKYL